MNSLEKGNIAVIFVSRRTAADPQGYAQAAAEMEEAVRSAPGYLGHDNVASDEGESITVSYWRDAESVAAWRAHARHAEVREKGRSTWYGWYRLIVAEIDKAHDWHR